MNEMARLLDIMARLRDPESGCPWDLEQSFATIAPHTVEEAYEVAQAIADGDMAALRDELGDLLFQVVFYAQMAREAGNFSFDDIARGISDKMVRRHPHVFGDAKIDTAAAQTLSWEAMKAEERAAKATTDARSPSALDGVARALPALTRALKLQKRAARVGFDWPDIAPVLEKLDEEITELRAELESANAARITDELGDLLFTCANLARHAGTDPEGALRAANAKFERRFKRVEALLAADGHALDNVDLAEMERLWNQAKAEEAG
jgi:MazG family protein